VIGRAPGCDIVLEHLSISRQHAELTTDLAGNLFLTDLGAGALRALGPARVAASPGRRPVSHQPGRQCATRAGPARAAACSGARRADARAVRGRPLVPGMGVV